MFRSETETRLADQCQAPNYEPCRDGDVIKFLHLPWARVRWAASLFPFVEKRKDNLFDRWLLPNIGSFLPRERAFEFCRFKQNERLVNHLRPVGSR